MAWCLTASNFLKQCLLIISTVWHHSPTGKIAGNRHENNHYHALENHTFEISHVPQGAMSLLVLIKGVPGSDGGTVQTLNPKIRTHFVLLSLLCSYSSS